MHYSGAGKSAIGRRLQRFASTINRELTCEYRDHFRSFLRHSRYRKRQRAWSRPHQEPREHRTASSEVDARSRFSDCETDFRDVLHHANTAKLEVNN